MSLKRHCPSWVFISLTKADNTELLKAMGGTIHRISQMFPIPLISSSKPNSVNKLDDTVCPRTAGLAHQVAPTEQLCQ